MTQQSAQQTQTPELAEALLAWYDLAPLSLPWRGSRDPYRIWLSEVMLQQTRVTTVAPYYERFLQTFPEITTLAAASLDEVLKQWEGLGYYARARNLHRLAQVVIEQHDGELPTDADALQELPGIGRYTAAAIASIAFGQAVAVLDGNVVRVLARLIDLPDNVSQPRVQKQLWEVADSLLSRERPGDYNQALMDLGRTVCLPRRPVCVTCPWQKFCQAHANGTTAERPVKKSKAPLPQVRSAAAVIRDGEGRLLLVQRPAKGLLGGLWTLPNGQCDDEESDSDCLRRTMRQEFGIDVRVGTEMAFAAQTFTHFHLMLRAFACEIITGKPLSTNRAPFAWVSDAELAHYSLGKADRQIVNALAGWQPRLFEEP